MKYKSGYKYQLVQDDKIVIPIQPGQPPKGQDCFQVGPFIRLFPDGTLVVKAGYAWDGCSGPTWDDDTNMRAGLIHDALYQLIRNDVLPDDPFREMADGVLKQICLDNGMSSIRAWYYHLAVRKFGSAAVQNPKKIHEA